MKGELLLICFVLRVCCGIVQSGAACEDVVYDSVKDPDYDVIYKPGLAFIHYSHEMFNETLINNNMFYIKCDPKRERYTKSVDTCIWYFKNEMYIYDENTADPGRINEYIHRFQSGCVVRIDDYPNQKVGQETFLNFTCHLENSSTAKETRMTYILSFSEDKLDIFPKPPAINQIAKNNEYFTYPGGRAEIECRAEYVRGAYVVNMNWFRVENDGSLVDISELRNHKLEKCRKSQVQNEFSSDWTLTLIIEKVTEEVLDRTYRCVAEKVDIVSLFQNRISDLPLQVEIVGEDNPTTPQNTADFATLMLIDVDYSLGGCTLSKGCMDERDVKIVKTPEIVSNIALGVGIPILIIVITCISLATLYSYRRRYAIRNKIKHKWKISSDVEDESFEYHVVLFANDEEQIVSDFLHTELRSQLEGKWRYNVMLPQRDAALGLSEADSRVELILKSQKSLFVITSSLLTDDWMQFALYSALKNHNKVIIIKFTDVEFNTVIEKIERDENNPVDPARKLTNIIDWETDLDKWSKLHLQLPLLPRRYQS